MPMPDWLRKLLRKPAPATNIAPPLPDDPLLKRSGPRTHHYQFAHYAVRQVARAHPAGFFGTIAAGNGGTRLTELWESVGEGLPYDERVAPTGLDVTLRQCNDYQVAIITLPSPVGTTEAFFTAFAVGPLSRIHEFVVDDEPTTEEFADAFQKLPAFYYTLEVGFTLPGARPRTVLGEWTADGSHANFGDGPPPTRDDFYDRVCQMLQ